MRTIAEGKDAVLAHFEDQLLGLPAHPGRYVLHQDDWGQLVLVVAGCTFIGEGVAVLDGHRLTLGGGVVRHFEPMLRDKPRARRLRTWGTRVAGP